MSAPSRKAYSTKASTRVHVPTAGSTTQRRWASSPTLITAPQQVRPHIHALVVQLEQGPRTPAQVRRRPAVAAQQEGVVGEPVGHVAERGGVPRAAIQSLLRRLGIGRGAGVPALLRLRHPTALLRSDAGRTQHFLSVRLWAQAPMHPRKPGSYRAYRRYQEETSGHWLTPNRISNNHDQRPRQTTKENVSIGAVARRRERRPPSSHCVCLGVAMRRAQKHQKSRRSCGSDAARWAASTRTGSASLAKLTPS